MDCGRSRKTAGSEMDRRCICKFAGFCPILNATLTADQHSHCRTDPAWLNTEIERRGITFQRLHVTGQPTPAKPTIAANPTKTAEPTCIPCEAAAKKAKSSAPAAKLPAIHPSAIGPVVSNRLGKPAVSLKDQFHGQRVFLFGGGPSLNTLDLKQFDRRGVTVAAMNNVATMIRPDIWFSVDLPRNFNEIIWRDPSVMKFTFDKHLAANRPVDSWDGTQFIRTGMLAKECPNTWGFAHRHGWDAAAFLDDVCPTWGVNSATEDPDGKHKQCSVMLPALWLLHWLGFRTVYLVGCDFRVPEDRKYAFDETMASGNESLLKWLDKRFAEVQPHFRDRGFTVLNCTEGSALTAFERLPLPAAIEATLEGWPDTIHTRGHYRAG
jgi:hypothetical protein